jgi:LuxR family maltose regulon positive regulatory protein
MCRRYITSIVEPSEQSGRLLPVGGLVYIALGSVLVEWNDLPGAEDAITKGFEAIKLDSGPDEEIRLMGGLSLARLRIAQGNVDGLSDLVDWITQSDRWSKEQVDTIRAHIWLMRSHREVQYLQSALRLVGERRLEPVEAEWDWEIWDNLTCARAFIMRSRVASRGLSQPDLQSVLAFLDAQYQILEVQGWFALMIETLILQALTFQALGKDDEALRAIERALTFAKPEGYIRIFIDEGPCMARLLYQAAQGGLMPAYIGKLLAAFDASPIDRAVAANVLSITKIQDTSSIVEPLTPRETEVLQLISEGLSNREITQRLSISLSTVKRHNANIYGKLAVNNRTQAVARARYLGMLN